MPFVYVYSPSDFVGGLPREANAQAAGSPVFTLRLRPGAEPTAVEISDNDLIFDEIDGNQRLTRDIDLDGTSYAAGTSVHTAYDLINRVNSHQVTSIHFGGDGYQQGPVAGLVSTVALVPGTPYRFGIERTSHRQNNAYSDYVACFADGTLIETDRGDVPVEALHPGDCVKTLDGTYEPLRLVLFRAISAEELREMPRLRPIKIAKAQLGAGLPHRDLWVSPQHRMLTKSKIAERMMGTEEVLIAASTLTSLPGIAVDSARDSVTYFHLIFDAHQIIHAEGAPTESFYFGPNARTLLPPDAIEEITTLFPDVVPQGQDPASARPIVEGSKRDRLVSRHIKNKKSLIRDRD